MAEVNKEEYESHKIKCSNSFDSLAAKMDKMELAMYGNKELDIMGVLDMTKKMYDSVTTAKGGEKIFWGLVRVASGLIAIAGAATVVIKILNHK